jgi:hypothetical protein
MGFKFRESKTGVNDEVKGIREGIEIGDEDQDETRHRQQENEVSG